MLNPDRIILRKHFDKPDVLHVSSFFRTIQGEGPKAGYPSVFLRLAGCNFGDKKDFCDFCDTNFKIDSAQVLSVSEVLNAITSLPGYNPEDLLVITGGEPTLQSAVVDLVKLVRKDQVFADIQFETNGTQAFFANLMIDSALENGFDLPLFVVSPKASNKGIYSKPSSAMLDMATCLKFVVSADPESPYHTLPEWALSCGGSELIPVYVSPLAVYHREPTSEVASVWDATLVNQQATQRNYEYAANFVLQNPGTLLSLQTHLFTSVP